MRLSYLISASTALAAVLLCCSCQKDRFSEESGKDYGQSVIRSISFDVDPFNQEEGYVATKSTYDADGNFYFAATDTVGIFPDKGSQVYFNIAGEDVGKRTVKFDGGGWALKESRSYWSYSPLVGEFYLEKDRIPVEYFDLTQSGNESLDHISPVDYLYTDERSVQDGSLSFVYHRLNCILRPRVTLPAGTYSKIVVQAERDVFVSKGHYDLTADAPSIIGDEFTDHLTLYLENATFTEETAFVGNLMTAPVDISNMPLKVIIYSGETPLYYYTYERTSPLQANTPYGLVCDGLKVLLGEEGASIYTKASSVTPGGIYLIVDAEDKRLFTGATNGSFVSAEPANNIIVDKDGSLAGYEFTVENAGSNYYLRFNDGKYLICDYSNNGAAGLAYVGSQSEVTYPFALTTGEKGAFFFSTTQKNNSSYTDQVLYYKAADGAFKIGGSGRTIGVHLYLKDGKQERGLSFNPSSVTCTIGSIPEKPVLSGVFTSVSYSSSDTRIATVDSDGNVKPVAPGIVTITATAEEDDEYNSGSAAYTLRIINAPSEEWIDLGTFSLENRALQDYLDEATVSYSDTDDATNSVMQKYATSPAYSFLDRKDCPSPVTITLANPASSSTVVAVYEDESLTSPIWSQNVAVNSTVSDVYNLIPGRKYYYTVTEDATVWEKGYFETSGRRRMIKVSDVERKGHANNCRDLGGLEVTDKGVRKTVKYGYLFRGTNMDKTTDAEKYILTGFLNIGMDVDLRNGASNSAGMNDDGNNSCYQPFNSAAYNVGYVNPGFNSFADLTTNDKVRRVITAIFETAKTGKASYFHCYIGADRTGYFAMLIEGLLGVSEKDCSIDYELTSFSEATELRYRTGMPRDYYFRQGIEFLRGQAGGTFQDKIENYLVNTVGISQADIDGFKRIVLE